MRAPSVKHSATRISTQLSCPVGRLVAAPPVVDSVPCLIHTCCVPKAQAAARNMRTPATAGHRVRNKSLQSNCHPVWPEKRTG